MGGCIPAPPWIRHCATVADATVALYLPSTALPEGSAAESAAARIDQVSGVVASLQVHARRLRKVWILLQEDYGLRFRTRAAHIGQGLCARKKSLELFEN